MATPVQVTFDCADPGALAQFWAEVLGYVVQPPPEPFVSWDEALDAWGVPVEQRNSRSAAVDPAGLGPRLFFQQVPEAKTAKNRVHLDLHVAAGETGDSRRRICTAEAQRLVAAGAHIQRIVEPASAAEFFIVMTDPEGNEFCVD